MFFNYFAQTIIISIITKVKMEKTFGKLKWPYFKQYSV